MTFVLRQVHSPGRSAIATKHGAADGLYLEWFDVDAHGGRGADTWTHDVTKAMRFPSFEAAVECWRTQSKVTPLRDDGEPNRPLTAYNISVEKVSNG